MGKFKVGDSVILKSGHSLVLTIEEIDEDQVRCKSLNPVTGKHQTEYFSIDSIEKYI